MTNSQDVSTGSTAGWPLAGGDVVRALLYPVEPKAFVKEYWGVRPLYVPGTADKFKELFSRDRFYKAVKRAAERLNAPNFRLRAVVQDYDGSWSRTTPITHEEIDSRLEAGSTICVNDISAGDEGLRAICESVKVRLNFAGDVRFNAYLSADGSGADAHIDTSISTTLQIEGEKRWWYTAGPAVPWPSSNAKLLRDGSCQWSLPWVGHEEWEHLNRVEAEEFRSVVLREGDVLCLPAGTWHKAKAVGASLALNMAFSPASGFVALMGLLRPMLEPLASWRSGPPPVWLEDDNSAAGFPSEVQMYFEERLDEVRRCLGSLDAGDQAVERVWRDLTERS